jgi:hypothetical protein
MKFINAVELRQALRGAQQGTFLLTKQAEASALPLLRR